MVRKTAFSDIRPLDSDSMPSSINGTPEKVKHVAQLLSNQHFEDHEPWENEGPSFSTPHREPASGPSKLMNSIFKSQFDAQKKREAKISNKSNQELAEEKAELEKLRMEVEKQKADMKLELDRFKRQNNALDELRKQRERELEITRMERAKSEKDGQKRVQELDQWERDLNSKLKEYRRLDHLHKEAEKSGMIRRKDFDEFKFNSAQRERELQEKCDRMTAVNARLKASADRLEQENRQLKVDNKALTERMDEVVRNSKRREGNTWREINRIVDQVTDSQPTQQNVPKIEKPVKSIKPRKPVIKVILNLSTSLYVEPRKAESRPLVPCHQLTLA